MDPGNPVIKLCIAGARAEFEGRPGGACILYRQAWEAAGDDYAVHDEECLGSL